MEGRSGLLTLAGGHWRACIGFSARAGSCTSVQLPGGPPTCTRPNRHTRVCQRGDCPQGQASLWWPPAQLAQPRRAIPHSAGKRHPGVDAALQPDLLRHCGPPLSAGAPIAQHQAAGDANRPAPQHDQQGVSPAGNRRRRGGNGGVGYLCARPAKATGNQAAAGAQGQAPAGHRPSGAPKRRWPAECRLHLAAEPRPAHPRDRLAPALWCPGAGQHPPGRPRRLTPDRRGAHTQPGGAGGSGADGGAGGGAHRIQQRHGGDQPLLPAAGGGDCQAARCAGGGR